LAYQPEHCNNIQNSSAITAENIVLQNIHEVSKMRLGNKMILYGQVTDEIMFFLA